MPDAIAQIGTLFSAAPGSTGSGILSLLGLGETGAGLVGNALNERTASQQQNILKGDEKVLNSPQLFNQQVAAAQAPLSQGLVQNVTNQVDANAASAGLSQAPGIVAANLSQSLAPFIQQNQSTAIQEVLSRLTGSQSDAGSILGSLHNTNLAPLLALLVRLNNPSGGANSGAFSNFTPQGPPTSLAGDPTFGDPVLGLPDGILNV